MNYPLISEYIEAIRYAEDNFDKLANLRPVLDGNGDPIMSSGNFAVVFKMEDPMTGKLYAVKCFTKEQTGRKERYVKISAELEYVSSPYILHFRYMDKELFVCGDGNDGTEYPVLMMDWVDGLPLDVYIKQNIHDRYTLQMLAYRFCKMGAWLLSQPFAHGDLKPDNILVRNDGTLAMVDYDGMYVPAMEGETASEVGSPDFQHPLRTEECFNEHIDDLSIASIALSLKAVAITPDCYSEYAAADRLLFSSADYRDIGNSEAFKAVIKMASNVELSTLISMFLLALAKNSLSMVSFRTFLLKEPEKPKIVRQSKWFLIRRSVKKLSKTALKEVESIVAKQSPLHEDFCYAVIFLKGGYYENMPLLDRNCNIKPETELDPESLMIFELTNGEKTITRCYGRPLIKNLVSEDNGLPF